SVGPGGRRQPVGVSRRGQAQEIAAGAPPIGVRRVVPRSIGTVAGGRRDVQQGGETDGGNIARFELIERWTGAALHGIDSERGGERAHPRRGKPGLQAWEAVAREQCALPKRERSRSDEARRDEEVKNERSPPTL